VLQALVSSGYEAEATEIVGSWIGTGLNEYEGNKAENWKSKDSAVYLLTAVATRGSTTQVSSFLLYLSKHKLDRS
jgi:exportin-2 (importin alpha re-exporter)